MSELHETIRGGERVLIRQLRPEDMALYPEFLGDISAEDLRLRFFARIAEFSAAEILRQFASAERRPGQFNVG